MQEGLKKRSGYTGCSESVPGMCMSVSPVHFSFVVCVLVGMFWGPGQCRFQQPSRVPGHCPPHAGEAKFVDVRRNVYYEYEYS